MIKINPKDVVSIPTDYDNAKGRCCEYVVVSEIDSDETVNLPTEEARFDDNPIIVTHPPGAVNQCRNGVVLATHDSLKAAATALGLTPSAIKRVCNGNRKSTGGFNWFWVKHTTTQMPIDLDDAFQEEKDEIHHHWED
jgi:hypothetical protein